MGSSGREERPEEKEEEEEEEVADKEDTIQDGKKDTVSDEEVTTLYISKETGRNSAEDTVQREDRDRGKTKYMMMTEVRIRDHEGKGGTVPSTSATTARRAATEVTSGAVETVHRITAGTVLSGVVEAVLKITEETVLRTEEVSGADKSRRI